MTINKEINTRLNLTIPKDLLKELKELAIKDKRATTNLIIKILHDYVDTQK